jgi:hypothetical protein
VGKVLAGSAEITSPWSPAGRVRLEPHGWAVLDGVAGG